MTYQPWTIRSDAKLSLARELMREHQIRHLPVLEAGTLVGVVSERDVAIFERNREHMEEVSVEDAMTQDVFTAQADDPVDKAIETMVDRKYGCTIVIDRHSAVEGIFTTIDIMQILINLLHRDALRTVDA
jgi:acetoin utilization protein AcuB